VPSDHEVDAQQAMAGAMAQAQGVPGHVQAPPPAPPKGPGPAGGGGGPPPGAPGVPAQQQPRPTKQQGPITNVAPARVTGGVG
jgi:hypothetical protein